MNSSNEPVVVLKGACVDLDGQRLVGPLDLEVGSGETVVLLGRSGSGKTTTLKMINALLMPTEGTVTVQGRATTSWDPVHLRRRIGYVIQEIGLFPHLSVSENVAVVPRLEGWADRKVEARVQELLELVGLPPSEFADRRPSQLSGGQRQRVGVARALGANPPIMLCDEPFGAVDPMTRRSLQEEFHDLTGRLEKTVVFVTHDVGEALTLGTRIIVLEQGRVVYQGTPEEFRRAEHDQVEALRGDLWIS